MSEKFDEQWESFVGEHSQDFDELSQSSTSRKFERKAERIEQREQKKAERELRQERKREAKQQQFDVSDFRSDVFVGAGQRQTGPRDFTGPSWLDDVDSDFVPPHPEIGPVRRSTLLYVGLLIIGAVAIAAALFVPRMSDVFGLVGGICLLLSAAGFMTQHRSFRQTRRGPDDDGARV